LRDDRANSVVHLILVIAQVQIECDFLGDDRAAETRIEIPLLVWRSCQSERIPCIEQGISKKEVRIATIIAGSCFADDLRTRKTDAAEFRAERIIVDPNFLNLILRRDSAARESIDHEYRVRTGFTTPVQRRGRLGGMLNYYYREAA
jgi:hypothetical protein